MLFIIEYENQSQEVKQSVTADLKDSTEGNLTKRKEEQCIPLQFS